MEVPQQTLLYDPYEEVMSLRPAGSPAAAGDAVQVLDPIKLASGGDGPRLPANVLAQAKEPVPPAPPKKGDRFDLIVPRGPVTANPLEEFNAVIITANNQADLALVRQLLQQLEEFLRNEGARVGPKLKIVPLNHADAVELTGLVNQLGARAAGQPVQPRPTGPVPGGFPFGGAFAQQQPQAAATGAGGSILLIPLPRQNSILMFGSDIRFPYYEGLIRQLDIPNANPLVPVKLEKASAQQVATQLSQLYAQRYPGSAGTLIRFTYDTSANTVMIQAGPADLEEIRALIRYLDTNTSNAVNELRVVRLRNTAAEDVANTLQSALFQNILPPAIGVAAPAAAAPAAPAFPFAAAFQQPPQAPGAFAQAPGAAARPAGLGSAATNTTKTVTLRFLVPGPKGGTFESGYLEDVHITPDVRSNSLLISAPRQTQDLLAAVIGQLDTPSAAQARVNIFTLKRADAVLTANLLQQLFGGAARQQPTQPAGGPLGGGPLGGGPLGGGPLGAAGPLGTTGQQGVRPLLTTTGQPGEGAGLVPLQVGVDDRTNSIIVAASQNDLDAIRAIIARLEAAEIQDRATHVIKLRNAGAVDVATALQTVLTQSLTVVQTGLVQTNYLELQRNVVVVPEPVTNNLLINATPQALQALIPVIERLDAQPLQVAIEVLIAEVALTNNEEFGIEVGLQSPVLFSRSVIPASSASFANATGGFIPPGVTINSTITQYAGTAFPFNTTANPQYNNAISPNLVGFQGITNYGVGRANANGVGGFVFSAGSDTVNVLIRALKTQGRVDNLTRPTVTVLDNQLGLVNVGGLYPYVTGGQFTALGTFQPQINQQQIGTTLEVVPRISPDGRILMRVAPSIIAPQSTLIDLGNGQFATAFSQQTVQTTVSVMDGETVVLGGLITKTDNRQENKVPWLGDLPYCGSLFRFRTQVQERRELLVILTPHVIRNCADSERLLVEEARKMSWRLKDVDALCPTCGPLPPGAGPGGPPPVLPPGVSAPPGTLPPPAPGKEAPVPPIPPAKNGEPQAAPVKPPVPELPEGPKVPDPPKASRMPAHGPVLTIAGSEPAAGIVAPGEGK